MARKSLFSEPMTPKQRALRSAANLRKSGGEVVGLRLDSKEVKSLDDLMRLGYGKNKSDAIRNAINFAAQYFSHQPHFEVNDEAN